MRACVIRARGYCARENDVCYILFIMILYFYAPYCYISRARGYKYDAMSRERTELYLARAELQRHW